MKKNKDTNWEPGQLWEGFKSQWQRKRIQNTIHQLLISLALVSEILFVNFCLLMEDDSLDSCGLIHIVHMKKTITDITSMLV